MKPKVIFLVGPTASGKSELAVKLALKLNAEIISCDSMQVYKGMEILSAVPHICLRKKVRHHLISYIRPHQQYNVARFRKDALEKVKNILKKGKIPLFVGGSGLYYKVMLDGIFQRDTKGKKIRERLYKEAENYGETSLYERLKKVDPLSASRIHPHDLKRIVRALEVYEKTGLPISEWQKKTKGLASDYKVIVFGLFRPKEILYKRIKSRVEKMFKSGVIEEVKKLLRIKLSKTAREAIGIKEIAGYLEGRYNLEETKRLIVANTIKLVKKQITWFKKDKRIRWFELGESSEYSKIIEKVLKLIN